jgi:hypothetical protein
MTKKDTIVEYSDPIALGGLDWQWEQGDRFALVEAVALCAANDWEYPQWARKIIDEAMTNMFRAVYPDIDLDRKSSSKKQAPSIGNDHRIQAKRLKNERRHSLEMLGLATDRASAVERRKQTLRNMYLAEEIACRCKFVREPKPRFVGVNKAKRKLAEELDKDSSNDQGRHSCPPECQRASDDMINRAWRKYRRAITQDYLNYG